ncbi:hypothetical protein C7N43_25445 [Sphingobacteriales bacterium UPWRP_1]|nr:hypothetical protein BVG80_17600 [Sphingobacteriales bacterium TSM_CSM]PSJ74140.1 hypothetical protein C7N43_25445 [Sphingobacteriales bacterium UPWRP_1]
MAAVNKPHLKQLYITGYILSYSGWYFNHVVIAQQLGNSAQPAVLAECEKLIEWIKGQSEWFMQNIPHVNRVAEICELKIPDVPLTPHDYFTWADAAYKAFYQLFPARSAEQLTFTFGFDLGNVSCNLELLKTFLFLQMKLANHLSFNSQVAHLTADLLSITERNNTTAALLYYYEETAFMTQAWENLLPYIQQIIALHPEIADAAHHLALYELLLQLLPHFHNTWSALLHYF